MSAQEAPRGSETKTSEYSCKEWKIATSSVCLMPSVSIHDLFLQKANRIKLSYWPNLVIMQCKVFNVLPFKRCRLWRFYSSRRGREMVFDWHIRAKWALLHYYKQKEIHETLSLPYRNYKTLVDAYAASLVLHKLISHNALSRTYKMSKVYIAELEWMVFANHLFITRVKGLHEILNLTLLVHSCYNIGYY